MAGGKLRAAACALQRSRRPLFSGRSVNAGHERRRKECCHDPRRRTMTFQMNRTALDLFRRSMVQPRKARHCGAFGGAWQAVAREATMDRRNKSGEDKVSVGACGACPSTQPARQSPAPDCVSGERLVIEPDSRATGAAMTIFEGRGHRAGDAIRRKPLPVRADAQTGAPQRRTAPLFFSRASLRKPALISANRPGGINP